MQVSGTGAGVGALIGALGRALVVICCLGPQAGIIALPSAGIGLLVGAIAGGKDAEMAFLTAVLPYTLLMGVAGAAAGGIGGYVGRVSKRNEQNGGGTSTQTEQPAERGAATDRPRDERFFER